MNTYDVYLNGCYEGRTIAVSETKAINNVRYQNYGISMNNEGFEAILVVDERKCKFCKYGERKSYIPRKMFCLLDNLMPHNEDYLCEKFKR